MRSEGVKMILGRQEYEDLLLQGLSVLSQSFGILIAVVGLVWSLIWFRDARLSARLAVAAFGLQLFVRLVDLVRIYLMSGWTIHTPYSTEDPSSFWLSFAFIALSVLGWMISGVLLLAALIVAWRRQQQT